MDILRSFNVLWDLFSIVCKYYVGVTLQLGAMRTTSMTCIRVKEN